jgi:regulator of sirC expression with transglutaminase-like and TPR domain
VDVPLNLQPRAAQVARDLEREMQRSGDDLGPAALTIARVEYPSLDPSRYLDELVRLADGARARLRGAANEDAIAALNEYLYDEVGFSGNRQQYDDPRNSFLNEVLDRRTGIPITLAVVYLEVARRAGIHVHGVNFPGHFLLRVAVESGDPAAEPAAGEFMIIDPFHGGARLSELDCRELLRQHVGEEAAFDRALLEPVARREIVIRMLVNLKRLYVRMRSFPQARFISDLLLAVDPSAVAELRDRGLLAYHLEDFAAALRDLEAYLRLQAKPSPSRPLSDTHEEEADTERQNQNAQIWEHVKTLRKRVASFN